MRKILLVLLIISLSLWCLLGALEKNTFNIDFYMESYDKYNIQEVTGKNEEELKSVTEDLFTYLKGDEGKVILQPNFNEREILHMEDVRHLFSIGFKIKYIVIFLTGLSIAVLWKRRETDFVKHVVIGLFVNWVILGILFLMIYFDFSKYFTLFHHIFFSNDLWILNPRTDLLIQMLPEEFFMSIATRIVISFISFISIIQFIGYIIIKKGKDMHEKGQNYGK
ncbi:MAG TPA: TIGR01906 family membrane protein [Tissierellaceae bacterium]|nr:TIGR01906 family membrane protein [Tissierellaceae bacterium]